MAPTILSRLDALLHDLGFEPCVKRSDFLEHVAARVVRARWRAARGIAPKASAPLSTHDQALLEGLLVELAPLLPDADATCWRILDRVDRAMAELGLTCTRALVSERICTRVGSRLVAELPCDEAFCAEAAVEIMALIPRSEPLTADQFERRYADDYDRLWEALGCASVSGHPPSEIRLGLDRRPHLVDASPQPVNNYALGTNRAVYGRYRLHFKASAVGVPRPCPTCASLPPAEPADPALAEVDRACRPFALAHPTHAVLLRSLAEGLAAQPADGGGWLQWATWASPCQPIDTTYDVDNDVVDAVNSAVSAWCQHAIGAPMVSQHGVNALLVALCWIGVRRSWMDLHRHERHFADALRRCQVPLMVRNALYRAFPNQYRAWVDGDIGDPEPGALLHPCPWDSAPEAEDETPRDRTLTMLAGHPDLARYVLKNDPPGWCAAYEPLVQEIPHRYLSATAAFEMVRRLIEEMNP